MPVTQSRTRVLPPGLGPFSARARYVSNIDSDNKHVHDTKEDSEEGPVKGLKRIQNENGEIPCAKICSDPTGDPLLHWLTSDADQNNPSPHHENQTITVIAGASISDRRSFFISRQLLTTHSTVIADRLSNPHSTESSTSTVSLPDVCPRMFRALLDYIHSGIYLISEYHPGFHVVGIHANAWVLGEKLGCKLFRDAALRKLYMTFEFASKKRLLNAHMCPIRAEDIQFACLNTQDKSSLRRLLFDAIASQYTQLEAMFIEDERQSDGTTAVSWASVYNTCVDFKAALAKHLEVKNTRRRRIFGAVDSYLEEVAPGVSDDPHLMEKQGTMGRGQYRPALTTQIWAMGPLPMREDAPAMEEAVMEEMPVKDEAPVEEATVGVVSMKEQTPKKEEVMAQGDDLALQEVESTTPVDKLDQDVDTHVAENSAPLPFAGDHPFWK